MKTQNFTYPVNETVFIDCKQFLAENPLDKKRQGIVETVAEMINHAFISGIKQEPRPWPVSTDDIITFLVGGGASEKVWGQSVIEFFSCLIRWMDSAYEAGKNREKTFFSDSIRIG